MSFNLLKKGLFFLFLIVLSPFYFLLATDLTQELGDLNVKFYFPSELVENLNFCELKRSYTFEVSPVTVSSLENFTYLLFLDGSVRRYNFFNNKFKRILIDYKFSNPIDLKAYNSKICILWDKGKKISFFENELFSFQIDLSKYSFIISPYGVLFLDNERFAVIDKFSPKLFVFSRKQKYLGALDFKIPYLGDTCLISDILFVTNQFFVSCSYRDYLCKFDKNGNLKKRYFGPGFDAGKLNFPQFMAAYPEEPFIFLVDKWKQRIIKFDYQKEIYKVLLSFSEDNFPERVSVFPTHSDLWVTFPLKNKVNVYYLSPANYLEDKNISPTLKLKVIDKLLPLVDKKSYEYLKLLYFQACLLLLNGDEKGCYLKLKKIFSQKGELPRDLFFFKMYSVYEKLKWRIDLRGENK